MKDSLFFLSEFLYQPSLLQPCQPVVKSCNHPPTDYPRFTSPPAAEFSSRRVQRYMHIIAKESWFDKHKKYLEESVQVAQYSCLGFTGERLERFSNSDCLIDSYIGPVVELMNTIFLAKGASPFVVTKETFSVDDTLLESFDIYLKDPKDTEVEHCWPCANGVFGIFLPPGTLHLDVDIIHLPQEDSLVSKAFEYLRSGLARRDVYVPYGILTDQTTTVMVNTLTWEYVKGERRYCTGAFATQAYTVRYILSALSHTILREHRICRYPAEVPLLPYYHGAKQKRSVPPVKPRWFSDFDMYTMQRSLKYWGAFLEWRYKVSRKASKELLKMDSIVQIAPNGFRKRHTMYAPSSYPKLPLSPAAYKSVHANRRPRDETVDVLLNTDDSLSFTVTKAVRVGKKEWSQVVFGRLAGHDRELCLKILDERLFPPPELHEEQFGGAYAAYQRLYSLVFSEDLVKREAAVYDRLPELQGSLLPHCYGFHLITLPSGWQAYGLLMELIDAPTLFQLLESQPLPLQEYKDLFISIKHGLSALGHATISQSDFNTNNIMCPLDESGNRTAVFIDFAFANLHLGDEEGVRSENDTENVLAGVLEFYPGESEALRSIWGPKDYFSF